jgi:5-methyltetrahydropteroyltriglutamate--homocysteine methyltransferase
MPAPFRADHIGSFLRPPELLEARARGADPETLRAIEDRHILRVLDKQRELGFEIFTDGEFRRRTFQSDFIEAVEGFDVGREDIRSWKADDGEATPQGTAGVVVGKLRQVRRLTGHETAFLMQHAPGAVKMTTASPTQYPAIAWKKGISDAAYPDRSALLADITAIITGELRALADEGVAYIQLDAPRYSYYLDPKWRDWLRAETGMTPEALLEEAIAADNACFDAARRPGVTLAIHLCRGNNRSQWYAEGGYDAIAERLFTTMHADRFLLEYDDERSGSFEPLRFVPKGKSVVLGLVSSKRSNLESADELARRVEQAARVMPLEDLALSPQCGFASVMEGNLLTEDEQWAKLGLIAEAARKVWGTSGR